jgi:hypothetical protein
MNTNKSEKMADEQFIRPEITFVFIRVHSWLNTFRPSGRRATKSVSISKIQNGIAKNSAARPDVAWFDLAVIVIF